MNCSERYLAVYDDNERKKLDRVPTFVQYIREKFIDKNKARILKGYNQKVFNYLYFDIPMILGFDSIFASFPNSLKFKSIKIDIGEGKNVKIREDGEAIKRKTSYYEGGYIKSLDILNELISSVKTIENYTLINKTIARYEKISPYIFPVLQIDGIFDRVWKSMGMSDFSYHFRKNKALD